MAGSRKPGPIGREEILFNLIDGTPALGSSARPGPVGRKPSARRTVFDPNAASAVQDLSFDPNAPLTIEELPKTLLWLFSMAHNEVWLRDRFRLTPAQKTQQVLADISSGFIGTPRVQEFCGPKKFFRGGGAKNDIYSGGWWFEEDLLMRIEDKLSRLYLPEDHERMATRDKLRDALAVCKAWNSLEEIWILEIPTGKRLTGLVGAARSQPVNPPSHAEHDPSKFLPGGAEQVFFPIKNPLWIQKYS